MAVLLDYIWQSTFCLLFFFGVYHVFLRHEKALRFSRFYLILTPLLALSFPLINIPVEFYKPDISLEQSQFFRAWTQVSVPDDFVATFGLPEVTVNSTKLPVLWDIKDYLIFFYFIVSGLLCIRLVFQVAQLNLITQKGWYQARYDLKNRIILIPTYGLQSVFSFFNRIFWDEEQVLTPDEREQIFKHEIEHVRQWHSLDILFYQLLAIVFWFNPVIHLMRAALIDVHEFLADDQVLQKTAYKEGYLQLVVKMAFKGIDLPIGNYFIRSTTLKRVVMMKKPKKIKWLKMVMVLPLTAMLMALVSMKSVNGTVPTANNQIEHLREELSALQQKLQVGIKVSRKAHALHHEVIGDYEDGRFTAQLGQLYFEFSNIKSRDDYLKVREKVSALRAYTKKWTPPATITPDHTATPTMGREKWTQQLLAQAGNKLRLQYRGMTGSGQISFGVDQEGKIVSPRVIKSFGAEFDKMMIKLIIEDTEDWIPAIYRQKPIASLVSIYYDLDFQTDYDKLYNADSPVTRDFKYSFQLSNIRGTAPESFPLNHVEKSRIREVKGEAVPSESHEPNREDPEGELLFHYYQRPVLSENARQEYTDTSFLQHVDLRSEIDGELNLMMENIWKTSTSLIKKVYLLK